jgi:DNA topoisomerase-1
VLRELGTPAGSEVAVQLLDGRYGPYVSDGTTNATVPRQTSLEEITLERAVEWIRAKADAGGGRSRKRTAASKSSAPTGARTAPAKKKAARAKRARSKAGDTRTR